MPKTPEEWYIFYAKILESFKEVSFWAKDLNGNFLWMSEGMLKRHNYDLEEIIGSNKSDATIRHVKDAEKIRRDDEEIIRTGIPKLGVAEELTNPDGTTRWALAYKFPLFGVGGNIIGVTGFSVDITSRKRVEKQLFQAANHVLHEAISDMNGTYQIIQLLASDPRIDHYIQGELLAILANIERTIKTTRSNMDLLSYRDGLVIKPREVDYAEEILNPAIEMVRHLAAKKGVRFDSSMGAIPKGSLRLMVDPLKFQLILKTLFTNAIEAGATVIACGYELKGDWANLIYWNNSPMIDEDIAKNIFTLNRSVDSSKKHGTGMGLNYCKNIIEHHSGRISLEDDGGHPRFRIRIPLFIS